MTLSDRALYTLTDRLWLQESAALPNPENVVVMEVLNEVGDRKLSNLKEMVEANKGQISARAGTLDSGSQSPPSSNDNTDKN